MQRTIMKDFEQTNWADSRFARGYREHADAFIVERQRMLSILQSFYLHFVKNGRPKTVLDLGCGDGIVVSALAEADRTISATLLDGSKDMLARARRRLKGTMNASFVQASFREMIRKDLFEGQFDLVTSSLAIHHLAMPEKRALFRKIFRLLDRGGYFVNIDVVLAPTERLEQWYLSLWRDWMNERAWDLGLPASRCKGVIDRYKNEAENRPDRLSDQLEELKAVGFKDVDCYYQYGIFTMFGGRKQS